MLLRVVLSCESPKMAQKLELFLGNQEVLMEYVKLPDSWNYILKNPCDLAIFHYNNTDLKILQKVKVVNATENNLHLVLLPEDYSSKIQAQLIGAGCDIILNPALSFSDLKDAIIAILKKRKEVARPDYYHVSPKLPTQPSLNDFISQSPAMKDFMRVAGKVTNGDSALLILGETGVGKERLARAIHAESRRSKEPFIAVNCGALPESLLESELFGHVEGAFTGATRSYRGCFELAHQGTIFLDEITEMPLHLQVKLLRVLENHEIKSLGSEKTISLNVRIMAATNRDIEEEVKNKQFRKDLYYRLNVVTLSIPSLCHRREDVPELVESYISYLRPRIGCDIKGITHEALDMLCQYSWPGNVRELINVVERAMLLCENQVITCDDLPSSISGLVGLPVIENSHDNSSIDNFTISEHWLQKPIKKAKQELIIRFEMAYLNSLLQMNQGRISDTAHQAGINEKSLYDKMRKYRLQKEDYR